MEVAVVATGPASANADRDNDDDCDVSCCGARGPDGAGVGPLVGGGEVSGALLVPRGVR